MNDDQKAFSREEGYAIFELLYKLELQLDDMYSIIDVNHPQDVKDLPDLVGEIHKMRMLVQSQLKKTYEEK